MHNVWRDAIRYPRHLLERGDDFQDASIRHSMELGMRVRVQRAAKQAD